MRVVLDTNVFLVSIPPKSAHHAIFQGVLKGDYTLLVSQDVLLEYEEILAKRANPMIAKTALSHLAYSRKSEYQFQMGSYPN